MPFFVNLNPTDLFTTHGPRSQGIVEFYVLQKRRAKNSLGDGFFFRFESSQLLEFLLVNSNRFFSGSSCYPSQLHSLSALATETRDGASHKSLCILPATLTKLMSPPQAFQPVCGRT